MPFVVRTAKQDRQAALTALHAAHAHIPEYVPAPDDSDLPRFQGHFFVTNQDGHEQLPHTHRLTCPTEASAKQCAAILNDALANGYWVEELKFKKGEARKWVRKTPPEWRPWPGDTLMPGEVARQVQTVLAAAWQAQVKARRTPVPPKKAAIG